MRFFLIKLAKWLLKFAEQPYVLHTTEEEVFVLKPNEFSHRVHELMIKFNSLDANGEWKAHNVRATVAKEFPRARLCDINLQMEQIYQLYFRNK